ncbi:MAG: alpha/beta hydrolase [Rhizomicrobium sp.]
MTTIYKSKAGARAVRERYLQFLDRWPVPGERIAVPTREGETFVLACGPKDAPALLLFHGSGANATMWLGDIGEWSKHFRCYAVDMIGEPGLSAPSRPRLDSEAHALWLDDVLAGLEIERASIMGVSLGGWLALDYATRRPGRVEKLALLCPGGAGRQRAVVLFALPLMFFGAWGRRKLRNFVLGDTILDTPGMKEMSDFASLVFANFRLRGDRFRSSAGRCFGNLACRCLLSSAARTFCLVRAKPGGDWKPT